MNKVFKKMRRKERALTEEETLAILRKGEYGVLSTVDDDGYPYGVPISYVYCDNRIWFHGAKEGHKVSNIELSNKASFCVVGNTKLLPDKFSTIYESAIAFGNIHKCTDDEKMKALTLIVEKYSSDYKEKGLKYAESSLDKVGSYYLEIEHITGKARKK